MHHRPCPLCHHQDAGLKYKVEQLRIVSCDDCDFTYLANPPEPEAEKNNYEHYFETTTTAAYSADSRDANIRNAYKINEKRLVWIKRYADGGRLLDVGCGRGFFLDHARRAGFEAEGVEISVAAARYASEQLNLTVHLCNLDHESTLDGAYDVITLWHSLEHFQQPVEVLERLWTLCAPGGRIFIEVPNLNSLKFQLSLPSRRWRGGNHPRYHRSFFTPLTLQKAMTAAGFQSIEQGDPGYSTSFLKRTIKTWLNKLGMDSFINMTAESTR